MGQFHLEDFSQKYSVRELATHFDFGDEWQAVGGSIRSKALYCFAAGTFTAQIEGHAMPEALAVYAVKTTTDSDNA